MYLPTDGWDFWCPVRLLVLLGALVVGRAQSHLDSGDGAVRCLGVSDSCTVKVDILQGFLKVLFFN